MTFLLVIDNTMSNFGFWSHLPHPRGGASVTAKYESQTRRQAKSRTVITYPKNEDIVASEGQSYSSIGAKWFVDNNLVASFSELYGDTSFVKIFIPAQPILLTWDIGSYNIVNPDNYFYYFKGNTCLQHQVTVSYRIVSTGNEFIDISTPYARSNGDIRLEVRNINIGGFISTRLELFVANSGCGDIVDVVIQTFGADNIDNFAIDEILQIPATPPPEYRIIINDGGVITDNPILDTSTVNTILSDPVYQYTFSADDFPDQIYDSETDEAVNLIHGVSFLARSQTFNFEYDIPFDQSECNCGDFSQISPPDNRNWVGSNAGGFDPCKHLYAVERKYGSPP